MLAALLVMAGAGVLLRNAYRLYLDQVLPQVERLFLNCKSHHKCSSWAK